VTAARVCVALVPPAPGSLPADACTVAIDVLRATTSLAVARLNGAARVVPFVTTSEAIAFRDRTPGTLACGEREGRIVPGFDLGNSPFEFTRERVDRKTLAFASTNGSRALLAASRCRRRLLGSFAALSATVQALANEPEIWLVCAGKLGRFALEDATCAGTIAARLASAGAELADPEARLAARLACANAEEAHAVVTGCDHGRWLASLGEPFAADVELCATVDAIGSAQDWGEAAAARA
jgi:2-phosphosulfolactate phosphatase